LTVVNGVRIKGRVQGKMGGGRGCIEISRIFKNF